MIHAPEHPEVTSALGNLGIVQALLGELEAARDRTRRADAIFLYGSSNATHGCQEPRERASRVGQRYG